MTGQEYNNQFSEEELAEEIWKDVLGYEGLYQVSNLGRVKSLNRIAYRTTSNMKIPEKILSPCIRKQGRYVSVFLSKNGVEKNFLIHYLVLSSFLPRIEKTKDKMECCHNNGNPTNNRVENLRWDTPSNNGADKKKHNTNLEGEKNPQAKLDKNRVEEIRKQYATGKYYQYELAEIFGVCQMTISLITQNKIWK